LKGNVIILLINRRSDRPICQEQASTAAVVVPCICLWGFAKGSPGRDFFVSGQLLFRLGEWIGSLWMKTVGHLAGALTGGADYHPKG
jgi:hypothetical protein